MRFVTNSQGDGWFPMRPRRLYARDQPPCSTTFGEDTKISLDYAVCRNVTVVYGYNCRVVYALAAEIVPLSAGTVGSGVYLELITYHPWGQQTRVVTAGGP